MSRHTTSDGQQTTRARCYTVAQLLQILDLPRSTFFLLKRRGQLPFLEEAPSPDRSAGPVPG